MRIGLITTSFPRFAGDPAGGFVADHARWLVRAGHAVEVIAAGDGRLAARDSGLDRAQGEGAVPGLALTRVEAGAGLFYGEGAPDRLARAPHAWWDAMRYSAALVRAVRRRARAWDGCFAHWLVPSGVAAALAAHDLPTVAIAHSGDVHLLKRLRLLPIANRLLGRSAGGIVFVSADLREKYAGALAAVAAAAVRRAPIVPMGIEFARFERAAMAGPASAKERATVAFVGRLVPVKGVDVLLAAAAELGDGYAVRIAGSGPQAPRLRERAGHLEHVELVGEVGAAARDRFLADADLLVIPSVAVEGGRTEGSPVVALEAMACGVPVVASRTGGLAELPEEAVTLVPPGNGLALARAVDRLMSDPARRRRQVDAGRELAAAHDWGVIGPRLESVLERYVRRSA